MNGPRASLTDIRPVVHSRRHEAFGNEGKPAAGAVGGGWVDLHTHFGDGQGVVALVQDEDFAQFADQAADQLRVGASGVVVEGASRASNSSGMSRENQPPRN